MAVFFTAASSQSLVNSTPAVLDYPITVGCWFNQTNAAGTQTLWSLCDTGVTNHYLVLSMTTSILAGAAAGGTQNNAATAALPGTGRWHFVIARFVSSTNRHLCAIFSNGVFSHGSTVTARAPAGLDAMGIGSLNHSTPTNFFSGLIGEIWYTNTDIQADGVQLNDATLYQLAFGGPFSLPHIAKDIIEYRSLRKAPVSDADEIGEVFHGRGQQIWTNTNGVTIGHHPPLPYWYKKPPNLEVPTWRTLLRMQNWGDTPPPPPWPPESDFAQPELYVTRGTQRF